MRKLWTIAIILNMGIVNGQPTSIYSFQIDSVTGNNAINLSAFQGKRILIINAASGDSASWQYSQIKQLYAQYKDSLAIVVLPTNSFNTESTSQETLLSFYAQEGNDKFPVTTKIAVIGEDIHPLYEWLTQKTKNGVMDSEVRRPFQKYLISKSGKLIGVFSARIKPFDQPLIQAITASSN